MKILIALLFFSAPLFAAPIHFAAQRGKLSQLRRYIEKKNVPVDLTLAKTGDTPLILAAGSNEPAPEVLSYLIAKGADVNAATLDGWSALMSAAQRNFVTNVDILLANGASPHMETKFGENALMIAIRYGSFDAARILVNNTPDLAQSISKGGVTPLMLAVQNEHPDAVRLLISKGAPLDAADQTGYTASMRINPTGSLEGLKALLEAGANPNAATGEGWTALMEAAVKNRPDAALLLLEAGADPKRTDRFGRSAAGLVKTKGLDGWANMFPTF